MPQMPAPEFSVLPAGGFGPQYDQYLMWAQTMQQQAEPAPVDTSQFDDLNVRYNDLLSLIDSMMASWDTPAATGASAPPIAPGGVRPVGWADMYPEGMNVMWGAGEGPRLERPEWQGRPEHGYPTYDRGASLAQQLFYGRGGYGQRRLGHVKRGRYGRQTGSQLRKDIHGQGKPPGTEYRGVYGSGY